MSEYTAGRWRRIYSKDWHAENFQRLTDAERQVYFYAMTGPQSTSVGIYRMSTAVAVEDIGNLTTIEFDSRLDVVTEAFGWRFDASTRVLWIQTWIDENPPQSPNVCVAWRKLIANLPDCDLKVEAAEAVVAYLKDKPKAFLEAFGKDFPKDIRISKAKPKAKTVANQGAGDSGIQVSGNQRTGALRARADTEKPKTQNLPNERLLRLLTIARENREYIQAEDSIDYRVDTLLSFARAGGLEHVKRVDAMAVISELSEGQLS